MSEAPVRIGVLGAAKIAPISLIGPARGNPDAVVACVAARDPARAQAFAAEHGVPHAAASYAELIAREDIDLVYVALPAAAHAEWSIRALEAGKAVLCEKPFAMNAGEARAMVAAAEAAGRPLLEAFHYRFHPVLRRAFALAAEGAIGPLVSADASFHVAIPHSPGELRWIDAQGGGALMDLGCYAVHALRTLAGEEPAVAAASCQLERGVDALTEAELRFPGGFVGRIGCSMTPARTAANVTVTGERGAISIVNFVAPQLGCRFRLEREGDGVDLPVDGPASFEAQLAHVVGVVRGAEAPLTGGADSIGNMAAMDAVRRLARAAVQG